MKDKDRHRVDGPVERCRRRKSCPQLCQVGDELAGFSFIGGAECERSVEKFIPQDEIRPSAFGAVEEEIDQMPVHRLQGRVWPGRVFLEKREQVAKAITKDVFGGLRSF